MAKSQPGESSVSASFDSSVLTLPTAVSSVSKAIDVSTNGGRVMSDASLHQQHSTLNVTDGVYFALYFSVARSTFSIM